MILWLVGGEGVSTWGTVLKGCGISKVANHWSREYWDGKERLPSPKVSASTRGPLLYKERKLLLMFQTFLANSHGSPSNSKDRQECTSPADTYPKHVTEGFQVLPTPKETVRAFMCPGDSFFFPAHWQHVYFTVMYLFFCYFFLSFTASWFFSMHFFPIWGQYFFFLF